MDEEKLCDICDNKPAAGYDEDDLQWCLDCMAQWEQRTGCYWATGQPKTNKPWEESP